MDAFPKEMKLKTGTLYLLDKNYSVVHIPIYLMQTSKQMVKVQKPNTFRWQKAPAIPIPVHTIARLLIEGLQASENQGIWFRYMQLQRARMQMRC